MATAHDEYDFESELARNDKVCGIPGALGLCLLFNAALSGLWKVVVAVAA